MTGGDVSTATMEAGRQQNFIFKVLKCRLESIPSENIKNGV